MKIKEENATVRECYGIILHALEQGFAMHLGRKKKVLVVLCLFAILIVGTVVVREFVGKQSDEYKVRVEGLLKKAVREIEEIRGLSPPEHVEIEVITVDWARENWGKSYAEAESERIFREERIYKALFMIPENASLYEAEVEWAGVIVTAVWQGKIYVVREYFDPWDEFNAEKTLLHELTHILQERYFHLPERATFDGGKAKAALIEGDACLVEEIYAEKARRRDKLLYIAVCSRLPESISRLNYFPYEYGLKFVRTLYEKGGWKTVNRAYEDTPTTTEQIMHLEKYFAGEAAKKAIEPVISEEGWLRVKNDRFGEYFILVMLSNWVPWSEALRAAEGWGGDNFTYYERGKDYLITWNITWDSPRDAQEFFHSFQNMMREVGVKEEEANLWLAHGRYLSIRLEGSSTLIAISTNKFTIKDNEQLR